MSYGRTVNSLHMIRPFSIVHDVNISFLELNSDLVKIVNGDFERKRMLILTQLSKLKK